MPNPPSRWPAKRSSDGERHASRDCRPAHPGCEVARCGAWLRPGRHEPDVAAVGALVAHDAVDHGDRRAVGREARARDLERRLPDRARRSRGAVDEVELGDPVVVGAGAFRRFRGERLAVGRPVVVVDVEAGRRDGAHGAGRHVGDGDALDLGMLFDDAGVALVGRQGARLLRGPFDEEEGDRLAVRRPAQIVELSFDLRHRARRLVAAAAARRRDPDLELSGLAGVRQKGHRGAVRREDGSPLAMRARVRRRRQAPHGPRCHFRDANRAEAFVALAVLDLLGPGGPRPVVRDRDVVELADGPERGEDGVDGGLRRGRGRCGRLQEERREQADVQAQPPGHPGSDPCGVRPRSS